MSMNYNVLIEEFCETYGLGEVKEANLLPTGLGNQTYAVETVNGKYVIKALNPSQVKTESDIRRLELTERISELVSKNGISSIPAKRINGKIVNTLHEQHYMVFDFFKGRIIPLNSLTNEICFEAGQLLADLHQMNFEELSNEDLNHHIRDFQYGVQLKLRVDWNYYLKKATISSPEWLGYLKESIDDLYEMFDLSFAAYLSFVPQDVVISHGDIFNQNILWKDNTPHIIDWESSGFIDATYDFLYTSIRWATRNYVKPGEESVDKNRLYAFIEGYVERKSVNIENLEISLYVILYKRLGYFRNAFIKYFNPKDKIAKERAEKQIIYTLSIFKGYKNLIDQLDDIKQHIIKRQLKQVYKKSPSYEVMSKIEQLIGNYNNKLDEISNDYKKQKRKANKSTKELEDIKKVIIDFGTLVHDTSMESND
ncbi:MAG: phosphotransferase [Defluviitaleaceae bacterium]|nr:phosphotransferase [Defluviitaleaceae bacterium]